VLPPGLPPPLRAELKLDIDAYGPPDADLIVTVNGTEARRFIGGPARHNAVALPAYYEKIFAGQGRQQRPWRGWYTVPVALEQISGAETLDVAVALEGEKESRSIAGLFGDYPIDGSPGYDGPSLFSPGVFADTSIYRFLGVGDARMRRRLIVSGGARSSFYDGHNWSMIDLSSAPGRQYGRYRIFLWLIYANGRLAVF
jgi:hypothetical protein